MIRTRCLFCGLAMLPLSVGVALAQPTKLAGPLVPLTETQMDQVTAGDVVPTLGPPVEIPTIPASLGTIPNIPTIPASLAPLLILTIPSGSGTPSTIPSIPTNLPLAPIPSLQTDLPLVPVPSLPSIPASFPFSPVF